MRDRIERNERSEKRPEELTKKEWNAPRLDELPPLTELALGSGVGGSGGWGNWDFP